MQRKAIRITVGGVDVDVPLGVFSSGQVALFDGAELKGQTPGAGGVGDVVGPASAVNGRIASFNGTSGKLIQDGAKLAADLVTGPSSVTASHVAMFSGTTGKVIASAGVSANVIVASVASGVTTGHLVQWSDTTGLNIGTSGIASSLITTHASRHNPGGADAMFTGTWSALDVPRWSGSAWAPKVCAPLVVSSDFATANTTPIDITGLTAAVGHAGTYEFEFYCHHTLSAQPATIGFCINASANFTSMVAIGEIWSTATAFSYGTQTANNTPFTVSKTITGASIFYIRGRIVVSGSCTLSLRVQTSANTITVLAGSGGHFIEV